MRSALLCLILAGCATMAAPPPGGLPTRAELIGALDLWDNGCLYMAMSDPQIDCVGGPNRVVRSWRCRAAGAAEGRPRALCTFSGLWVWRHGGRQRRFGPECAYLGLAEGRTWVVQSFPDADRCAG